MGCRDEACWDQIPKVLGAIHITIYKAGYLLKCTYDRRYNNSYMSFRTFAHCSLVSCIVQMTVKLTA